jgi:hypothetical protein
VPTCLSSPIERVLEHPAPAGTAPEHYPQLLHYLAGVPGPRGRRGRRYPLCALLAVTVCAALAGARSLVAIGEWAADASVEILAALGIPADPWRPPQPPDEATMRRVLARVDGDALDTAIGDWLLRLNPPAPAPVVEPPIPRAPWRALLWTARPYAAPAAPAPGSTSSP